MQVKRNKYVTNASSEGADFGEKKSIDQCLEGKLNLDVNTQFFFQIGETLIVD